MNIAQALAHTAHGCGIQLVTHVPGYGASETFDAYQTHRSCLLSLHEEVAFGMAFGSALTGHPALCLIKMHGLLKASNALVCALSAGVTAAFVTLVFEDRTGSHSDNQLPTRAILEGLEIPFDWCQEPTLAPAALEAALHRSQAQRLPRVLVVDSDAVALPASPVPDPRPLARAIWRPDPLQHLVCPLFGDYQRATLLSRLGHECARSPAPALPHLSQMPPRWAGQLEVYRPWVEALLAHGRPDFVAGDTGLSSLFGLEPYRAVDAIGWMGGSLPIALGALAGGQSAAWAITGDFSFSAAGLLGWLEARRRQLPLRVFLFDNGCARATGGQPLESGVLEHLLGGDDVVPVHRPQELQPRDEAGPLLYWLRCGSQAVARVIPEPGC